MPAPSPPTQHWNCGRAVEPAKLLPGSCPGKPRGMQCPGTRHTVGSTRRGSEVSPRAAQGDSVGAGPTAHGCVAQLALGVPTGENTTGNSVRGVHISPAAPAPALHRCPSRAQPRATPPQSLPRGWWEHRVGMCKRCPGSCCTPTAPLPHLPCNSAKARAQQVLTLVIQKVTAPTHAWEPRQHPRMQRECLPSQGSNRNLPWEQLVPLTPPSSSSHPSLWCSHPKAGDRGMATTVASLQTSPCCTMTLGSHCQPGHTHSTRSPDKEP